MSRRPRAEREAAAPAARLQPGRAGREVGRASALARRGPPARAVRGEAALAAARPAPTAQTRRKTAKAVPVVWELRAGQMREHCWRRWGSSPCCGLVADRVIARGLLRRRRGPRLLS